MTHIRKSLLLMLFAAASAQAQDSWGGPNWQTVVADMARGTVLGVGEWPGDSGWLATGYGILLLNADTPSTEIVIIPSMSRWQTLPRIGETCTFDVHVSNIAGMSVSLPPGYIEPKIEGKSREKKDGKVVDSFDCGTGRHRVMQ